MLSASVSSDRLHMALDCIQSSIVDIVSFNLCQPVVQLFSALSDRILKIDHCLIKHWSDIIILVDHFDNYCAFLIFILKLIIIMRCRCYF